MTDNWRKTLSIYVNQQNQDEVDYRSRDEITTVTDLEYLMKQGERKQRLKEWYADRQAIPIRAETRAKLIREIEHREGELEVDLQLFRNTYYEKGGAHHDEQRVEIQRLTLIRYGDEWVITKVEQYIPERHAAVSVDLYPWDKGEQEKQGYPRPFLNQELLGNGSARSIPYRRENAVQYADRWWNSSNPEFANFDVNCTNYISQCLFAGGAPINYTGTRDSGWWYKGYVGGREAWSYSWTVAAALERHLRTSRNGLRGEVLDRPEQLQLGDVILYDWDGNGHFQHSTIVTAFDAGGMPLVNAHTTPSRHRYWDYKNSHAWTVNTKYRYFHIVDRF